jgi:hypothetical protein
MNFAHINLGACGDEFHAHLRHAARSCEVYRFAAETASFAFSAAAAASRTARVISMEQNFGPHMEQDFGPHIEQKCASFIDAAVQFVPSPLEGEGFLP